MRKGNFLRLTPETQGFEESKIQRVTETKSQRDKETTKNRKTMKDTTTTDLLYKFCPGCGRTLPTSAFGSNRRRYDHLQSTCKECRRERYLRTNPAARYRLSEIPTEVLLAELHRREADEDREK